MYPHQQRVEGNGVSRRNHNLGVENKLLRANSSYSGYKFRKVPRHGLARLGLKFDDIPILKHKTAKAIPLRFVLPLRTNWDFGYLCRFHRKIDGLNRKFHVLS